MGEMDNLYIIQSDKTGVVKVGRSGKVGRRLRELQTASSYKLRVILELEGMGYREREFHEIMSRERARGTGEWFNEAGLGLLPSWIYEQLAEDVIDGSWWRVDRDRGV